MTCVRKGGGAVQSDGLLSWPYLQQKTEVVTWSCGWHQGGCISKHLCLNSTHQRDKRQADRLLGPCLFLSLTSQNPTFFQSCHLCLLPGRFFGSQSLPGHHLDSAQVWRAPLPGGCCGLQCSEWLHPEFIWSVSQSECGTEMPSPLRTSVFTPVKIGHWTKI